MEALIVIDVQNGLLNKNLFKKDEFVSNINKTIIENRNRSNLIIIIQHNSKPLETGTENWQIYSKLERSKNEIIIQKKHGNIFENTNLKQILVETGIKDIIICGLVSHGCVYYSCISGIKNGFNVKIIENGHTNWLKNAEEKIIEVNNNLKNIGVELIKE